MKWIGLTGSIGAGKSTVAAMLRKAGYVVIDADSMAHEGLKPGSESYAAIVAKFGTKILNDTGEIQRRELGKLIFAQPELRSWLEGVLHPMVQNRVKALRQKLESEGQPMAFYEVPLLFEKNLQDQFDKVVVVWVSESVQQQRLQQRNSWSLQEIAQRNNSQIPVAEKVKRANFAINNDQGLESLEQQVDQLIHYLNEEPS